MVMYSIVSLQTTNVDIVVSQGSPQSIRTHLFSTMDEMDMEQLLRWTNIAIVVQQVMSMLNRIISWLRCKLEHYFLKCSQVLLEGKCLL